ncbi:MAG TPA: hypothetical protein VNQ52_07260 [Microbacteriaceae bacterium]|nr:hypothetical protein [Microbacteriaceae bacterium]
MNDEDLLAVAYRGRPATIAELATLSHVPVEEARTAVRRLRSHARLGGRGERITYSHPANWAAESVASRTTELRRSTDELLAQIEQIVGALPGSIAHWSVGEASSQPMPVLARHGPRAAEDLWYEIGRHGSGVLEACLPDISRFLTSSDERIARASQLMRAKDGVRMIIPTAATEEPAMRELLVAFTAAGIEYRFLDDPPSWFWVDGDQLAVPFEWGEGRPTSVMSVRSGALAGMVSAYFATLWRAATPPAPAANAWTPLLALMRKGITLETASRMIGVNPRTGRRRIAQAMGHYGVSTLFALGVAWAADTESRP